MTIIVINFNFIIILINTFFKKNNLLEKYFYKLITFKYFQPFLKKFLYSKSNDISYNKKRMLNQQIFGLKDDLDLVQFFIKQIENSKNIETNN